LKHLKIIEMAVETDPYPGRDMDLGLELELLIIKFLP